jgi:prevent-host-death family protein
MADRAAKVWQIQEAKQRLSQVLQSAVTDGPQFISKHGQDFAVVLSIGEFSRLTGGDFKDHLRSAPDFDALELSRSREIQEPFELE